MNNEYLEELTSKEIKERLVCILNDIDLFCRENDLTYYISYGTLLGAIRHKGFIPWDDDIDIVMPRDSYEQFANLYNRRKSAYRVLSFDNTGTYCYPFAKVVDTNTVLVENVEESCELGIYVDVFPLDNLGSTITEAKRMNSEINIYRKMLAAKQIRSSPKRTWYSNAVAQIIRLVPISQRRIISQIEKTAKKNYKRRGGKIQGNVVYTIYGEREIMPNEWYKEGVRVIFEGKECNAPANYHEVLRQLYGDYMQLPPTEKRVTHHDYKAWVKRY